MDSAALLKLVKGFPDGGGVSGADFDSARKGVEKLEGLSDDQKLFFYGLFKQSTVGDVNISAPWAVEVVAKAKWTYWNKFKGCTKEAAKLGYVRYYRSFAGLTDSESPSPAKFNTSGASTLVASRASAENVDSGTDPSDSAWKDVDSVEGSQRSEGDEGEDSCSLEKTGEEEEEFDEDSDEWAEGDMDDTSIFSASDRDHLHFHNGVEIKPFRKSQRKLQTFIFSLFVMALLVVFDYQNRGVLFKCVTKVTLLDTSSELYQRLAAMTADDVHATFSCTEPPVGAPLTVSRDNSSPEGGATDGVEYCAPEKFLPLTLSKEKKPKDTLEEIIINKVEN